MEQGDFIDIFLTAFIGSPIEKQPPKKANRKLKKINNKLRYT